MKTFKLEDFCTTSGLYLHLIRHSPPAGYYESPHVHDYTEVIYIQKGCGVNSIGRFDYPIISGDIYVIPPKTLHSFCIGQETVIYNLLIDFRAFTKLEIDSLNEYSSFSEIFTKTKNSGRCLHLSTPLGMEIANMLTAIHQALRAHSPGYAAELHARTLLILSDICKKAESQHDFYRAGAGTAGKLSRLMAYLTENFRSPVHLEAISDFLKMTPNSISRFFMRNTGLSLVAYTNQLRIREACRLLVSDSDRNVTEIAGKCGFHDTSYFIRVFKKQMKISPLAFRRKQMKALNASE